MIALRIDNFLFFYVVLNEIILFFFLYCEINKIFSTRMQYLLLDVLIEKVG
jgi:hypothetical protein